MTWIITVTGKRFDFLDPKPETICPVDIAHALSHVARFNGHTRQLYSVAEHSVRVAAILPPPLRLYGLLHDATEAYVQDITSPLKALLPEYRTIEARVWAAIVTRFNLEEQTPPEIKHADSVLLATELRDLMPQQADLLRDLPSPLEERIVQPWTSVEAKRALYRALLACLEEREAA